MNPALIAIIIFILTYVAIATEKVNRTVVAFVGALLLILFGVFGVNDAVGFIDWETIGLLFGMFIIVAALSDAGFFTFLALILARWLNYSPRKIFIFFPIITAILSAFMDSVTVMLFFATLTYEICKILKINAATIIITEVVMANIGGSSTMVGDPPNVILGLKLGFYFNDFLVHNAPISILAGATALLYCYMVSRKSFVSTGEIPKEELKEMDPTEAIEDRKQLKVALAAFGTAIFLLITHPYIEEYLHIPLKVPLAAMIPAFFMLVVLGKRSEKILLKVNYEVLLFFMGLFMVVGALEYTGVIEIAAGYITTLFKDNHMGLLSTLLWGSGLSSGVIDNVPLALSMSYILQNIVKFVGVPALSIMVWATSMGLDIGGNFTPIGASANVVAYTVMEKRGQSIGWKKWLKLAVPATLIALVISNIGIFIKYITGFF
ncbi:MAG: SLC13 family permease [Actinomycetota bacterium]|nr:SLC13 family permease [Actinomycetota bacterium]